MKPQPATQTAAVKECRALYNRIHEQLQNTEALHNLTTANLKSARNLYQCSEQAAKDATSARIDAKTYADAARWCLLIATVLHAVALALYFTK